MAKVSVIVPVYNVAPYLKRCIDSLLSQTFHDFELILVNDGSRDEGGAICDEYAKGDKRVIVLHQRNGGLSAARNRGIEWAFTNSESDYLAFIDSDDWVAENYLEELYKGCTLSGGCAAVVSQRVFDDEAPQTLSKHVNWDVKTPREYWGSGVLPMTAWGKMYPKPLFEKMRYPVGKIHEDEYVTHRILFQCEKMAILEAPLYYYFQRRDSIMGQGPSKRSLDVIPALEDQLAFFSERGYTDLMLSAQWRLINKHCEAITLFNEQESRIQLRLLLDKTNLFIPCYAAYKAVMPWLAPFVYPYRRLKDILARRGGIGAIKQYLKRFTKV